MSRRFNVKGQWEQPIVVIILISVFAILLILIFVAFERTFYSLYLPTNLLILGILRLVMNLYKTKWPYTEATIKQVDFEQRVDAAAALSLRFNESVWKLKFYLEYSVNDKTYTTHISKTIRKGYFGVIGKTRTQIEN